MVPDTLVASFQRSAAEHPERAAMGYERAGGWHTITYAGVQRFVEDLAAGLLSLDVAYGDRVAIWSANSPEWVVAHHAILHAGGVVRPVDATLAADRAADTLDEGGARVAFVDDEAKLEALLSRLPALEALEHVVVLGPVPAGYADKAQVLGTDDLYTRGRGLLDERPDALADRVRGVAPSDPAWLDDDATALGGLGGVVRSHADLASNVEAIVDELELEQEGHLASLPLTQRSARTFDGLIPFHTGSTLCLAPDGVDPIEVMDAVEPTVMLAQPAVLEQVRERIEADVEASGRLRQRLSAWALDVGREVAKRTARDEPLGLRLALKHRLADRLVLAKLREAAGGRLRCFVTGDPGLSPGTEGFLAAVGLPVVRVPSDDA